MTVVENQIVVPEPGTLLYEFVTDPGDPRANVAVERRVVRATKTQFEVEGGRRFVWMGYASQGFQERGAKQWVFSGTMGHRVVTEEQLIKERNEARREAGARLKVLEDSDLSGEF